MVLWLFLLAPLFYLFGHAPTVVLENDPSTLVDGVSVITGDFYLGDEDYSVAGAEPIPVRRFYLSGHGHLPQYPHMVAKLACAVNHLFVSEPNGTSIAYEPDPSNKPRGPIGDDFFPKKKHKLKYNALHFADATPGVTNTSKGVLSAKSQLKNQKILFDPAIDQKGKSFTLYASDGTVRRYASFCNQKRQDLGFHVKGHVFFYYKLVSETLPNGRIVHYDWDSQNRLLSMRTSNPQNTKTFACLRFPLFDPETTQSFSLQGSDGRSLSYTRSRGSQGQALCTQVFSPDRADQQLSYTQDRLDQITLPAGRKLAIQYEDSRVTQLLSPLGPQGELVSYLQFTYDPERKTSSCKDALGHKTAYFWNDDLRLTSIERWTKEGEKKNRETFVWNKTNLRCKVFYDSVDIPLFAKTYTYDAKGNVLKEVLWGNLTGKSAPLHIDSQGFPLDDGVEKAVTESTYDERNLLTWRQEPSGLVSEYTYLPHAQLLTSKTLLDHGQVLSKTTYTYDMDHTLIREVTEEGSQYCHIQEIVPRAQEPYLGLPDKISTKYREQGREHALKTLHLSYTTGGKVCRQKVYDAEGVFRYALDAQYDDRGHLLEETNPIGQKSIYRYDSLGNQIYIEEKSGQKEIFLEYDLANRLTKKREVGHEGIERTFVYSYDLKDNLISSTDPYGNTTTYEYDLLGGCTQTRLPLQQTPEGVAQRPLMTTAYDSMGHPILSRDAEENETTTTYNILGKPIAITHPDGTLEENLYDLAGRLIRHTDPLGIITEYTYDALGHVTSKKTEACEEHYVYDGNLLIEKIDPEGYRTSYRYDGAGRKIAEEKEGEAVFFSYNPLGRLFSRTEGDLVTLYHYDLLGQLLQEEKRDLADTLLEVTCYEYDSAGHVISITQGKASREERTYDSLGRLTLQKDPLGSCTTYEYTTVENDLGQQVLQKTTTDPMGLKTLETFDAHHRKVSVHKIHEKPLYQEETIYDLNGRKRLLEEVSYTPTLRRISCAWHYDSRGRLKTLVEGSGMKTTQYRYNARGEKVLTIKPDGTELVCEYNALGHLTRIFSSDGSVDHHIIVDKLGREIAFDGIVRTLDPHGRILEETFPQALTLQNRYDTRGRKTSYKIPLFDLEVHYRQGALDLEEISFQKYTHRYTRYDLTGQLLEETLMGDVATLSYTYDLAQRPLSLRSSLFSQEILSYDAFGNLLQMEVDHERRSYTYDRLYQLTSETGPFSHSYTCDAFYNRVQRDLESYNLNALNQLITHCEYDPNGNPIQIGSIHLTYDALDRLIHIQTPTQERTLTYDALHRRLSQQTTGEETLYWIYDGQSEIGSYDHKLRDFRVLGRTQTAEVGAVAILIDQELFIPITDLQGNIAKLVSPSLGITTYRYGAFGEEKVSGETLSPWRFSSKRVDPLTGFVHYGRREYVPSLGRWLTPDPLGFTDGSNLYAFVHNAPLTHLDAYGLYSIPISYKVRPNPEEERFTAAMFHEVGSQALAVGKFAASTPYFMERGLNYLTGRQELTLGNWQERQLQLFNRAEDWLYRANPTDQTHPNYLMYRKGINITSLLVGGYGLLKGGVKAAQWSARLWKTNRGAYVAGEKLSKMPIQASRIASSEGLIYNSVEKFNKIWSATKERSSVKNAFLHWQEHGADFPELLNAKQYAEAAKVFINNPPPGTLTKIRTNCDAILYNPSSNSFVISNAEGLPRTMYKPSLKRHPYLTNLDYFNAQK